MPESENALWAKTRRRNMAAPRAANRAERERRRKGAQSAAPRRARRRAAFRRRRAQIGWRSKKRLCYALFCPSAFFVKHSANFLKNAKDHHKFICANDNIALRGGKSPRAAPRFCGRLLEKTSAAKLRARIVGQRQAPRRRTERSESAAEIVRKANMCA